MDEADHVPDPFAMPPMAGTAIVELATVADEPVVPPRRKWPWVVGGAVAVLAVIGAVVFATRGDDGPTYSLEAAAEAASEAQNVAFEMTITQLGTTATSTGRFDVAKRLMAMQMTLPEPMSAEIEGVFDMGAGVIYMDSSTFGEAAAMAPTKWISMDLSVVPGLDEVFQSSSTSNPLDVAKFFTTAKSVEEVGMEEVGGLPAKRFLVTVAMADVLAKFPTLADSIEQMGVTMEDEIVYDVWVGEANELRRVAYSTTVNGQEQSMDIVYDTIGHIDPIVLPQPDEVTDISDMLGG